MLNNSEDPWLVPDFCGNTGSDSPALELGIRYFIMLRENLSSQVYQESKLNVMELFLRTTPGRHIT